MKCDGYRILIREMLQGKLNVEEATVVAAHMDACSNCRAFHRELVGKSSDEPEEAGERNAPSGGRVAADRTSLTAAVILGVILFAGILYVLRHEGYLNGFVHRGHGPAQHHCSAP